MNEIIQQQLIEQGFKVEDRGEYELKNHYAEIIMSMKTTPKIIKILNDFLPYRIIKRTTYQNFMDIGNTFNERLMRLRR